MKPKYGFYLQTPKIRITAHPIFGNNCTMKWSHDANEQYFRQSLSGEFTFVGEDFDFVYNADIETKFNLIIYSDYGLYWTGTFYKTDCEFNIDDRLFTLNLETKDAYSAVLDGVEKEYDLIKILPRKQAVSLDKRSMIQIYAMGEDKVSCFFQGMTWEQDCETIESDSDLTDKYHFAKILNARIVEISGDMTPKLPNAIWGDKPSSETEWSISDSTYTIQVRREGGLASYGSYIEVVRKADKVVLWRAIFQNRDIPLDADITLLPVSGTGATGNVILYIHDMAFYGRLICDVESFKIGSTTYNSSSLSSEDMVSNNRNFHRVFPYAFDVITIWNEFSSEPTEWYYKDDLYYTKPPHGGSTGVPDYYPIAQTYWTRLSYWFSFDMYTSTIEPLIRKEYTFKDAYPLWSVIDTLLSKITKDSGYSVDFKGTKAYSQFLYDTYNPISQQAFSLFLTPKSNILAGEYSQPAQKAKITLRKILDMLRDAFRCYWWLEQVSGNNYRLRIEHISYFMNGGAYFSNPQIGLDLTKLVNPRTGKAWSFGVNTASYDKDELPERYEFKWVDDTTSYFEGNQIEIKSKYVKSGDVESITIDDFNSDIDYMLFNPSAAQSDGFALLSAVESEGKWKVAYYTIADDIVLQNGFLSFYALQTYYLYDMPAWNIEVNDKEKKSNGVKKSMKQSISCPYFDFDLYKLIHTGIGDGQIDKVEMNLDTQMLEIDLIFTPK